MPIYEYRCASCGFEKDFLQKVSDPILTDCPECGKATFEKQLTAAGFQLKGSGWYATDFKNSGAKPAVDKSKPAASSVKGTTDADKSASASEKSDASSAKSDSTSEKSATSSGTSTSDKAADTKKADKSEKSAST
jgi:putative FmdB family regulatory protein